MFVRLTMSLMSGETRWRRHIRSQHWACEALRGKRDADPEWTIHARRTMAARRAGVPIILHGVHILPFLNVGRIQSIIYTQMERAVAPYTDAYIAVSEGIAALVATAGEALATEAASCARATRKLHKISESEVR